MSRAPYQYERPEQAYSSIPPRSRKTILAPEEIGNPGMGTTAENLAKNTILLERNKMSIP